MVLSLVILGKSLNKSKNQKTADQPKYSVILWKRQIVILHCRKKNDYNGGKVHGRKEDKKISQSIQL